MLLAAVLALAGGPAAAGVVTGDEQTAADGTGGGPSRGPVTSERPVTGDGTDADRAASQALTDRGFRLGPVPDTDRVPAPPVAWQPCDPDDFPTFADDGSSIVPERYTCADYTVPLDYSDPGGEQITLALIRRPADDPAARQGTIFPNFGGPGGLGVQVVASSGERLFGPEVLERFDIVGVDPRGFGGSTPLQCYEDTEAFVADLLDDEFLGIWPTTSAEWRAERRDVRDLAGDCERTAGPIIDHMGTTTVARDFEVLRRAVGDEQLNFVGYSYGTYICASYVNLFPDRAGAVVCDGNIDPVEYATGEPWYQGFFVQMLARAEAESGGNATLAEFFRLCDEAGPEACALAPGASARFDALYEALDASPVELVEPGSPEPTVVDEQTLVALGNSFLYSWFSWPAFGTLLAELERLAAGGEPPAPQPAPPSVVEPPANEQYAGFEGFYGVSCSDNVQPWSLSAWRRAVERADGYLGPLWASGDIQCADWPAFDRDTYFGPFDAETATPVLVVNPRFDAATPYEDGVAHAERLPNAALLTVEGWGHTSLAMSACADAIVDEYLLTRTVPGRDLTCSQDIGPFELVAPAAAGSSAAASSGVAETVAEDVSESAAGAALAELAETGDAAEAAGVAAQVAIDAVAAAGDPATADRMRARQDVLDAALPALAQP